MKKQPTIVTPDLLESWWNKNKVTSFDSQTAMTVNVIERPRADSGCTSVLQMTAQWGFTVSLPNTKLMVVGEVLQPDAAVQSRWAVNKSKLPWS